MTGRTRWNDGSFDVILDKAMLDALLTSELVGSAAAGGGSRVGADADDAADAAPTDEAANGMSPARAGEQAGEIGSAWSDTSAGDLSAALAYLAEVHRLLVTGEPGSWHRRHDSCFA